MPKITQAPNKGPEDFCRVPRECLESSVATREAGAAFFLEVAQERHTLVMGPAEAEEEGERMLHMKVRS